MRTRNILMALLLVSFYGCQPETPQPKAAAPAAGASAESPAPDADGLQLAKQSNCLGCHALDKKLVGPSFRDVAAKYRGDAGAEARLAEVIARGSSGTWGAAMMPPNPQLDEASRNKLAKFVLSLQ